ncbi:MAG: ribonuclease HII [Chloroflexi bacterium]|nr:ribonuclease HII [Chloroflexota bacterium]
MSRPTPTLAYEDELRSAGYARIAGLDEAGRGPLAGPVAAAAVILPADTSLPWLARVNDSKLLSAKVREELVPLILAQAAVGLGMVSSATIDEAGIVQATKLAMLRALDALGALPQALLIDAVPLREAGLPYRAIVHGDSLSSSVACASIVAKVARDRIMVELDSRYPGYGFARHKGYGTPEHLAALARLGPSPVHRRTFAPVRRYAEARSSRSAPAKP